jgi:hypothetical protein
MRTKRGHLPVQIGVRLQSSLKAWLDQRADLEETSVSTLVRTWVVRNRLCCNLREIVVADEILDGTNMIDQLFGE